MKKYSKSRYRNLQGQLKYRFDVVVDGVWVFIPCEKVFDFCDEIQLIDAGLHLESSAEKACKKFLGKSLESLLKENAR